MGTRDFQSMVVGEEEAAMVRATVPSMAPDWMVDVAVMMRMDWRRKEVARVPRRRGCRRRERREKKKAPIVKQITEVRDLAQP